MMPLSKMFHIRSPVKEMNKSTINCHEREE